MKKEELARLIHDYNLPCKNKEKECTLCWRIAGQVLILMGMELTDEGAKRREITTDSEKRPKNSSTV